MTNFDALEPPDRMLTVWDDNSCTWAIDADDEPQLHAIKCAQHAAPAFAFVCLCLGITGRPHALACALAAGPGIYAGIIAHKVWKHTRPNWPDWVHDTCFALLTLAGGALAEARWTLCAVTLGAAVTLWVMLHRKASP